MILVYGTSINGVHTDTSKTMKGAKRYATLNGFKNVTKRIGYNSMIIFNKVGNKWIAESIDNKAFFYDNGGKTFDRITIVIKGTEKNGLFECIGSSGDGIGYFTHSQCNKGNHLGRKVKAKDLDKYLQGKLRHYFNS